MYLSDKHIKEKLNELSIECEVLGHPFDPDSQIQPCSIDLRLGNVFWEAKKSYKVDLRTKTPPAIEGQLWKKKILKHGEVITIKPRHYVLARTYEKVTIPNDCAGKLEGRSSFARLGLGTHFASDFINAGYRGQMPLELYNYGENDIIIFPYIPICQLVLIKLTSEPDRMYKDLPRNKYMNESGGPSRWWLDDTIEHLQQTLRKSDITLEMQNSLIEKMADQPAEVMQRFIKFTQSSKIKTRFETKESMLEIFRKEERNLELSYNIAKWLLGILVPGIFGIFLTGVTLPGFSNFIALGVVVILGYIEFDLLYFKRHMSFYTSSIPLSSSETPS